MHKLLIRPVVSKEEAVNLARTIFGLQVTKIKELDSYDDRNFYMEGELSCRLNINQGATDASLKNLSSMFVFKVMHSKDTYDSGILDAIEDGMNHLNNVLGHQISLPVTLPTLDGKSKALTDIKVSKSQLKDQDAMLLNEVEKLKKDDDAYLRNKTDQDGNFVYTMKHYVRLLTFVPGEKFPGQELSYDLVFQAGQLAARIVDALEDFSRPALITRNSIWDMKNLMSLHSACYLDAIGDLGKRSILYNSLNMFKNMAMPSLSRLPSQTIHSDLNEANLLVQHCDVKNKVTGLIDFGDMVHTYRVFEVSTCMLYLSLLKPDDCIRIAGIVLAGYLSETLLTQEEFDVLYYCVIGRIVMSLTIGNYQCKVLDPGNEYLLNTAENGWKVLNTLLTYKDDKQKIMQIWLDSCNDEVKKFYSV